MTAETPAPPAALGDFFKAKAKKKIKSSNLNNSNTSKPEGKKPGKKDTEEDGWEEQEVVAATIKVEVAGQLTREEETKQENTNAPAWGSVKNKAETSKLSDKKFPSLQKSVQSSNINIDDGSNPTINIKTSKNVFSALENDQDSDDDEPKRPTEIKPAMVKKKKGEFEKVAVQREVDKYAKKDTAGKKKQLSDDDEDEDEDDGEEEEQAKAKPQNATETKKKKKAEKREEQTVEEAVEIEEDLKIQPDLAACKAKYARRRKLPAVQLPAEELEEKKIMKASTTSAAAAAGKKRRKGVNDDEDDKKKLLFVDE